MGQKMFIPVTDEILYDRPELITSPLRPFQVDHPCFRWLSAEIEAVDPASVDIDASVELNVEVSLAATALRFAPVERGDRLDLEKPCVNQGNKINNAKKYGVSSDAVAEAADQSFQRLLRKKVDVSCKDAA